MRILRFGQFVNERAEMSGVDGEILVQRGGKSVQYTLVGADGILGDIRVEDGHVQAVSAEKGYGPLMYEIAMMDAYPAWLRPGSGSTTDQAFEVWKKFAERPDVESAYAGEQGSERSERYDRLASMKFRMKPSPDFSGLKVRDVEDEDERMSINKKAGAFFMKKMSAMLSKHIPGKMNDVNDAIDRSFRLDDEF
jgi:hypothetical protein